MRKIAPILLFTSSLLLLFSIYSIINWFEENKENEIAKNHSIEVTNIKEENKEEIYPYLYTDFTTLLNENKNVKGWIQVPDTNINYPVLQYTDNDYYLNHNYYNQHSTAGWIFLDYRNSIHTQDMNTIIYAHNRLDGSMFYTLKNTLTEEWNNHNKYIYFNTLKDMNTYEVFSVYTINAKEFKSITNHNTEKEYQKYLDDIINKSIIPLNVQISTTDKILTLYTCTMNNIDRTILHAKLIQTKSNR